MLGESTESNIMGLSSVCVCAKLVLEYSSDEKVGVGGLALYRDVVIKRSEGLKRERGELVVWGEGSEVGQLKRRERESVRKLKHGLDDFFQVKTMVRDTSALPLFFFFLCVKVKTFEWVVSG